MTTVLVVNADLTGDPADMIKAFRDASRSSDDFAKNSQDTSSKTQSSWGSMGKAAGVLAGAVAAAFSVKAIVDFATESINQAANLQQSSGAVEAVFKEQSATIQAASKEAAEAVGLSSDAYNQYASLIGTQMKTAGFDIEEAASRTQKLIGTAADLSSMFGGTTADAVGALSAAFRGEYDSLEKYGLAIKEGDINARLAAMGLDKLTGEQARNARAVQLQAMIMEQSADSAGNFTKEANTLQGQQQRLTAEFQNQQAALGTALLPAMTELAGMARDILPGAFSVLQDILGGAIETVSNLSSYYEDNSSWINVLVLAVGGLTAAWMVYRGVASAIAAVQLAITAATYGAQGAMIVAGTAAKIYTAIMNAQKIALGVATAAQWLWNAALTANPIGIIITAIAALVAGIIWFFTQTELGQEIWSNFMTWLTEAWTNVSSFFTTLWQGIVQVVTDAWNAIVAFVTPVVEFIAGLIRTYVEIYVNIFLVLAAVLKTIWEGIAAVVTWVWNGIVAFLTPIVEGIASFISDTVTNVQTGWETVWGAISSFFEGVWTGIQNFLKPIVLWVLNTILPMVTKVKAGWDAAWSAIGSFFKSIWDGIVKAVSTAVSSVSKTISGIYETVMGVFTDVGTWLYDVGKNLIEGFFDGVESMWTWITSQIGGFFEGIVGWAKDVLGIASPSKVMMEVGVDAGRGVVEGLKKMQKQVKNASLLVTPTVPTGLKTKALSATWDSALNTGSYGTPDWMKTGSAASRGAASGATPTMINIEIVVQARPGDDLDTLADKVAQRLQFALGGVVEPVA